jgi:hypothetical protein
MVLCYTDTSFFRNRSLVKKLPQICPVTCWIVAALLGAALDVWAAPPEVQNLQFAQRTDGSRLVDITYDVSDADEDVVAIAVKASVDNGLTWQIPLLSLTGDWGQGVVPGPGKHVIWDIGSDLGTFDLSELTVQVVASDSGVEQTSHSPEIYWIMEWSDVDWSDEANIEKIAKGDVAVLGLYGLWNNEANEELDVIAKIRALNPDIVLLGYFLAKTNMTWWKNTAPGSFTRTLYDRTEPYWSYTTTGDTLSNWPGQIVLNILNPACRDSIVQTLAEFQEATNNKIDGVLWDYFEDGIWIHPDAAASVDGDPDMDGDGIPMNSDPDERVAYLAACDSLVLQTRADLGDDFIQVFNGVRAHKSPEFAALGDGMYYEIFPTQVFPDPDMTHALDPNYQYSLFNATDWPRTVNGGPFIVVGMYWHAFYNDLDGVVTEVNFGNINRVVALLTDTYATWILSTNHNYHWPEVEFNLGPPLGPTVIDGGHYTREFMFGQVDMTFETGKYPNPFRYTITIGDQIVEALDVPYHHP